VDWRCRCDRPARGAEAEARPASCSTDSEVDGGEPLSQDLGSDGGGARPAAVVDASSASGTDADQNQEPTATHSLEPGLAEETQAMEQGRAGVAAEPEVGTVDRTTTGHFAGDAGGVGRENQTSGLAVAQAAEQREAARRIGDASWGRAGDFTGYSADHGRCKTISRLAQLGKLSGAESIGAIQRTATAAGVDQQAREPIFTISPGARGSQCSQGRQGSGPDVQTVEGPEAPRRGQGGGGPEAGGAVVLDGAHREILSRGRSHAGEPESSCG
jgi:hypothetical protein